MQSPLPTLALCIFYAYFCKTLAPRWMENRKPFGLRRTLIIYNLFQTVFSAWIFYEVSFNIFETLPIKFSCQLDKLITNFFVFF